MGQAKAISQLCGNMNVTQIRFGATGAFELLKSILFSVCPCASLLDPNASFLGHWPQKDTHIYTEMDYLPLINSTK